MAISSSSTGLRPGVCTSTTRPTNPYLGQIIYQTDDGQMLVWNGSSWGTLNTTANGNVIINGNFDIWQRWVATSINVSAGTTAYTADRWFLSPIGATMGAVRTTNIRSGSTARYVYEITPNGVGGSTCRLGQRIEAANVPKLRGTVTFSAWIFNNTGATITPNLLIGTPSAADNFTTVTNLLTQSLQSCATSTWTRVSHTVDISGYTNLTNGLQIEIETSNHTTFGKIVRISEVQLELGSKATPFEQRPFGAELALCQRYYYRYANASGNGGGLGYITGFSATRGFGYIYIPTEMRGAITITPTGCQFDSLSLSNVGNITALTPYPSVANAANTTTLMVDCTLNAGGVAGTLYHFRVASSGSIQFSAEL